MPNDDDYPFLRAKDVQDLAEAVRNLTRTIALLLAPSERRFFDAVKGVRDELVGMREDNAGGRAILTGLRDDINQLMDVMIPRRTNGHTEIDADPPDPHDPG